MTNRPPLPSRADPAPDRPAPVRLGTRLVIFGTAVTLAAVALSFLLLSLEIRRQTRAHLVALLDRNQRTVLDLQRRSLAEMARTSRLMTQSPTLRAALDTFVSESADRGARRPELLATIWTELDKIRELLGGNLAMIADTQGAVLAASRDSESSAAPDPGLQPVCPIDPQRSADAAGLARTSVMRLDGEAYQVGCVPIVLQDFVIGTLALGRRLDAAWIAEIRSALDDDALLALDGRIAQSTLGGLATGAALPPALETAGPNDAPTTVVGLQGEEYVVAALDLGPDAAGARGRLYLLQSLTRAYGETSRPLRTALIVCGLLAVCLAGAAGWRVSRTVLDPLERFVAFVRAAADSGDRARRFEEGPRATAEIRSLNQAYNLLMDSLERSERRLLQQAREDAARAERLKESEKLASLGRMLSGAAHEINNPLTGVIGNIDMLLASGALGADARARLEKVRREAQRITALVRNLLKVAHRDTGERTAVDLHQLLRETAALRHHDFVGAGLQLRLQPGPAPLVLEANELELQQVFLNIINNALDALKESACDPVLAISTRAEGDHAVLVFEDGGAGLKDPSRVFEHFYTTKQVGKGTGLGMSLSQAIVQHHGGVIEAANRPEGGARFTIRLPLAAPRAEPVQSAGRRETPPPAGCRLPLSVLVVEDEPAILDLQLAILATLGATAIGAPSGAEAIASLRSRDFDLIVSDVRMPGGISGPDLFAWIEANQPQRADRVLFVTGDVASDETLGFLEKSGRPCLAKPFSVDEFVNALREAADGRAPVA